MAHTLDPAGGVDMTDTTGAEALAELQDVVRELLDAEEMHRLHGATMEHQSRLARARRRAEALVAKEPVR